MKKPVKKAKAKVRPSAKTSVKPVSIVNKSGITPLRDRVLVRTLDIDENTTSFGLIIPDTVDKEKSDRGVVVAVGEGWYTNDGKVMPLKVKVGDKVIFSKYSYEEVKQDGKDFYILKEENILAILN
jgi:chaperonin GroES